MKLFFGVFVVVFSALVRLKHKIKFLRFAVFFLWEASANELSSINVDSERAKVEFVQHSGSIAYNNVAAFLPAANNADETF